MRILIVEIDKLCRNDGTSKCFKDFLAYAFNVSYDENRAVSHIRNKLTIKSNNMHTK